MEDPWGSPWAVANTAASPPKIDLPAAPPSVHFPIENGSTTTGIAAAGSGTNSPRRSIHSPWGDDNEDENVWGGWNDASTTAGGTGSPAWGRSPGLMPIAPSLSSRGASPDPWRLSGEARRRSSSANKRPVERIADSGISLGTGGLLGGRLERKPSSESGFSAQDDAWTRTNQPTAPSVEVGIKPLPLLVTTPADEPVRPDTMPRPEKGYGDDEPNSADAAQTPSKVQELVDHYDSIAKLSMSPVSPSSPEPLQPRKVSSGEMPLEEASAAVDRQNTRETEESLIAETQGTISHAVAEDEDVDVEEDRTEGFVELNEPIEGHLDHPSTIQKQKSIPIDVPIDMSKLNDLFPSTPEPKTEPELVPDVIIDDTFISISERKVWYRLSRKGSKLMHSGDLESYVRMDWSRSTVRQDTLKTVRRWMEEDSMAGRPRIGRKTGVVGSSAFNWNSSGPAVEISELLRMNKGHARQASSGSKGSLVSPRVASFEWASPPTSPVTATDMPVPSLVERFRSTVSRPTRPQSLVAPPTSISTLDGLETPYAEPSRLPRPSSLIASPPEPIVQPSISTALSQPLTIHGRGSEDSEGGKGNAYDNDEDDDDWGEMVTSPDPEIVPASVAPPISGDPGRRESTKTVSSTTTAGGIEAQGLHGGFGTSAYDTSSSSIQQSLTPDPLIVPDSWDTAGLEASSRQGAAQSNRLSQAMDPEDLDHKTLKSPTSQFPKYHNSPLEDTRSNPALSSWFDEPTQPTLTPNLPLTPPAGSSVSHVNGPQSPSQASPIKISSSENPDEELLSQILQSIPDLSYMLR